MGRHAGWPQPFCSNVYGAESGTTDYITRAWENHALLFCSMAYGLESTNPGQTAEAVIQVWRKIEDEYRIRFGEESGLQPKSTAARYDRLIRAPRDDPSGMLIKYRGQPKVQWSTSYGGPIYRSNENEGILKIANALKIDVAVLVRFNKERIPNLSRKTERLKKNTEIGLPTADDLAVLEKAKSSFSAKKLLQKITAKRRSKSAMEKLFDIFRLKLSADMVHPETNVRYGDIIPEADFISLEDIKKKSYANLDELRRDFDRMFSNCEKFWGPGHGHTITAEQARQQFEFEVGLLFPNQAITAREKHGAGRRYCELIEKCIFDEQDIAPYFSMKDVGPGFFKRQPKMKEKRKRPHLDT